MDPGVRKRARSQPKSPPPLEKSDETRPYKEGFTVKYVILFLVLLFAGIFLSTYFALGAIGMGNDSLSTLLSKTNTFFLDDFEVAHSESMMSNSDNTPIKPRSEPLTRPTILWWTDKLFPHFQGKDTVNIECRLGSCLATTDKSVLSDNLARGILFYGTDFRAYEAPLPRQPWHEWALIHEESPLNNQIFSHKVMMSLFNHTSTFSRKSDFPLTTQHLVDLKHLTDRKPVEMKLKNAYRENLAPILYVQTHCNVPSDRDRYIKELMKHIDVDSYGKCINNKKLPENLQDPVESMFSSKFFDFIARYKFHLAFENGICEDYVTEKVFRPLHVGSVPIYRGSSSANDWMPNDHSIILVDDFDSPKELAAFIKRLDENDEEYLKYLQFKEENIQNEKLRDTMESREWGVNEWRRPSFINAFECYLCDLIIERLDAEQTHKGDPSHPLLPPRMAEFNHVGCPEPFVSFGDIGSVGRSEDIHFWKEDYWTSKEQAVALKRMIERGATDSSKLFDELQQMFVENGRNS